MLQIENVSLTLNGKLLLSLNEIIEEGSILTVMGPSGCGKSSLLAYIGGFLNNAFEAAGSVKVDGSEITGLPAHERGMGVLFQDPLLFPHMSVGENLLFALPGSGLGKAERRGLAEEALSEVGLDGFFDRDPATLSGGQKARVALMRVLLSEPRALLLDEPFSKLDAGRRGQIREIVFDIARRKRLPTLLVTHDEADATATGGRVIDLGSEEE